MARDSGVAVTLKRSLERPGLTRLGLKGNPLLRAIDVTYESALLTPLDFDRGDLLKKAKLPGLHTAHSLLDHHRRCNAPLVLVTDGPCAIPSLQQEYLIARHVNTEGIEYASSPHKMQIQISLHH